MRHVQVAAHGDLHARRRRILQARGRQHAEARCQLRVRVLAVGRREVQALWEAKLTFSQKKDLKPDNRFRQPHPLQ